MLNLGQGVGNCVKFNSIIKLTFCRLSSGISMLALRKLKNIIAGYYKIGWLSFFAWDSNYIVISQQSEQN